MSAQAMPDQQFLLAKSQFETMRTSVEKTVLVASRGMQLKLYPERSHCVAVILHGLFQSPRDMQGLINYFYDQGCNVVAPLLAGHWNIDNQAFYKINFETWITQITEVIEYSQHLGDKVILVGHSTGSLLAIEKIVTHSEYNISHAILFAPAIKLKKHVIFSSLIGSFFNVTLNNFSRADSKNDKFLSEYNLQQRPAIAGLYVKKLIENIFGRTDESRLIAYKKIQIPTLIISTENDETIDHSEVLTLKKSNPNFIDLIVYSKNSMILHDNIQRSVIDVEFGSPKEWINPDYDNLLQKISAFLDR